MTLRVYSDKIAEAFQNLVEALEELADKLQKVFEKIEEHERLLLRPPKWYIKANNPAMIVGKSRLFHCRNNC